MTKRKTRKKQPERSTGPLTDGLREHQRLRNEQRYLLTSFPPLVEAFDEQLTRLRALADVDGLHPEVAHLIRVAIDLVITGIDHMMSIGEPHDVEEARKLMETDFLFREFAAAPNKIDEWATLSDFEHNQRFGFGKLRDREERRQGLPASHVLPERDQWTSHSVHSHPLPSKDVEPALRHPSFSLLNSAGDLFNHVVTVEVSARNCVVTLVGALPAGYEDLPESLGREFYDQIGRVLNSHITDEQWSELRTPRPKTQTHRKYWQNTGQHPKTQDR